MIRAPREPELLLAFYQNLSFDLLFGVSLLFLHMLRYDNLRTDFPFIISRLENLTNDLLFFSKLTQNDQ